MNEVIKKKRGRPASDNPSLVDVHCRVTPEQKERWALTAKKNGLSLSKWIKELADNAS